MRAFDSVWRARFERFGRTYAEEHQISGWSAEGLARRLRLFAQVLSWLPVPDRARILELGCGAGTYVRSLAGLGHSVVGVDYSLPSLQRAVSADPGQKGRYMAADGYALPFERGAFDLVICLGVLQAVSRPRELIVEVSRVLRPEGVAVVEALNSLELPAMARRLGQIVAGRPSRVRAYSPFRVRRWLEAGEIRFHRQIGVYLPPRPFPGLGRLLDRPAVMRALEAIPGGSLVTAHAFWLVGQKSP